MFEGPGASRHLKYLRIFKIITLKNLLHSRKKNSLYMRIMGLKTINVGLNLANFLVEEMKRNIH